MILGNGTRVDSYDLTRTRREITGSLKPNGLDGSLPSRPTFPPPRRLLSLQSLQSLFRRRSYPINLKNPTWLRSNQLEHQSPSETPTSFVSRLNSVRSFLPLLLSSTTHTHSTFPSEQRTQHLIPPISAYPSQTSLSSLLPQKGSSDLLQPVKYL